MMNAVLPSSIPTAPNNTSYIDQRTFIRLQLLLHHRTDGTEFTTELVGLRDVATSRSPSPPPQECHPRMMQLHPHPHSFPLEALPPPNNDRFGFQSGPGLTFKVVFGSTFYAQ
ncbi:hypothetical protein CY34DRAFT_13971 [Suillus luteus UH-Slu-Lm8-n1]|uniref:Uncharacterized protein n=1 Tax=Suillus luteus UH-Slu-Lm8-n1 TaxID=930992 RepID=A0A0D0B8J5_9AGAM|nr:hypothetical protein CY34DRAFT_13971 [Suillus luteus UH-Slu-Lm8-n1]